MKGPQLGDGQTSLDVLEREDIELEKLFGQLNANRHVTVEERAEYGDMAKTLVRRVATRESALVDVTGALANIPALRAMSERLRRATHDRREAIDRVEKMSRGVQGINLNAGQDFDVELGVLMRIVGSEIEWELGQAIPTMKRALAESEDTASFKSERHVTQHAPTNLDPSGPRWLEQAPIISRLITLYDHLRDFPKASRH
ncbi:MAG TPA: hypothetical protein VGL48_06045 [Acidimicrobiales bacterium]